MNPHHTGLLKEPDVRFYEVIMLFIYYPKLLLRFLVHVWYWEHILMIFFISICTSQYQIAFPFDITHAIQEADKGSRKITVLLIIFPYSLRIAFTFFIV